LSQQARHRSDVCPAQNNPGGLVAIIKKAAVRHGLPSTRKTLVPYSRILYKLTTTSEDH
jgi:heterodisulfide reductase subunit C